MCIEKRGSWCVVVAEENEIAGAVFSVALFVSHACGALGEMLDFHDPDATNETARGAVVERPFRLSERTYDGIGPSPLTVFQSRRRKRCSLPVSVRGNTSRNSIARGYL